MIVAGIDPSLTNTGIAILTNGQPTHLHSIGFGGRDGANYDQRSDRIVAQSNAVIRWIGDQFPLGRYQRSLNPIDLAVIEGPAYGHNLPSNHDRAGLWWGLYSALRAKHVPTAVIAPATRAKWATGHGRALKTEILTSVRAWWPDTRIANHDIADAAVLAAMGAARAGDPLPFQLSRIQRESLDVVAWPVMEDANR